MLDMEKRSDKELSVMQLVTNGFEQSAFVARVHSDGQTNSISARWNIEAFGTGVASDKCLHRRTGGAESFGYVSSNAMRLDCQRTYVLQQIGLPRPLSPGDASQQHRCERRRINWEREEGVGAVRGEGSCVRCEKDDRDCLHQRIATEDGHDFDTAHVGHMQIQQQGVRPKGSRPS